MSESNSDPFSKKRTYHFFDPLVQDPGVRTENTLPKEQAELPQSKSGKSQIFTPCQCLQGIAAVLARTLKDWKGDLRFNVQRRNDRFELISLREWGGTGTACFRLADQGVTADIPRMAIDCCNVHDGSSPPYFLPNDTFLGHRIERYLVQLKEFCSGKKPYEFPNPEFYASALNNHLSFVFPCFNYRSNLFEGAMVLPLNELPTFLRVAYLRLYLAGRAQGINKLLTKKWIEIDTPLSIRKGKKNTQILLKPVNGELIQALPYGWRVFSPKDDIPRVRRIRYFQHFKKIHQKAQYKAYVQAQAEYQASWSARLNPFIPQPKEQQKPSCTIKWCTLKNLAQLEEAQEPIPPRFYAKVDWFFDQETCSFFNRSGDFHLF